MDIAQGKAFKAKRKADNLSAQKLADKLGTTRESVYKWETGIMPRDKEMQQKVKDYINGAPVESKPISSSNGTVPHEDFKQKYESLRNDHFELMKKHTALLETLLEKK